MVRVLFVASGALCLAAAFLYNEWLIGLFHSDLVSRPRRVAEIRNVQAMASGVGLFLLVTSMVLAAPRMPARARRLLDHPMTLRVSLLAFVLVVPLFLAELALRPFAPSRLGVKTTTIFVEDADLGWKLRPGARGMWGGVSVEINDKGLRGPEIPYERSPDNKRVLYLGDSVAFGYKLPKPDQSFPYVAASSLRSMRGVEIETVNAAVGGYSPWQHLAYLEQEGVRYQPDLVVLSFVLNDVTEKLRLTRFGGHRVFSRQLRESVHSRLDRLSLHSALARQLASLRASMRFGADLERGATRYENVTAKDIVASPHRPAVLRAWDLTFKSMDAIVSLCRERSLPVVLVAFPYRFQLDDASVNPAPQRVLAEFAEQHGIPYLDLLPALRQTMTSRELAPDHLFIDHGHLSTLGNRIAGQAVARVIADSLSLPRAQVSARAVVP